MSTLVVVGAVNVDLVVRAPRLPGPGETVVGAAMQRFGGGKGANAAVAAARAGAAVRFAGAVGDDDLGAGALDELRAEGVDVASVAVLDGIATGVALIVVDERGENQIAVGAGANARVSPGAVGSAVGGASVVLVSTEIPAAAVLAAVAAATAAGVVCVLNPAPVLPELVGILDRGAVLTPNAGELADLAAAAGITGDGAAELAAALAGRTGAAVIVTLGGDGALVVEPGSEPVHLAPEPVTVVDTTGAGDAFNGTLAARLAAGDDIVTAGRAANAAAARAVTTSGAR